MRSQSAGHCVSICHASGFCVHSVNGGEQRANIFSPTYNRGGAGCPRCGSQMCQKDREGGLTPEISTGAVRLPSVQGYSRHR